MNLEEFSIDRPHCLRVLERIFVVVSLLVFSRAFIFHFFTDVGGPRLNSKDLAENGPITPNHPELLFIYISIYCVAALVVCRRWQTLLHLAYREKFIALLLLLATFSALWSFDPSVTLTRTIAMSGTTLFGIYFALRFNLSEQLGLLGWAFAIAIGSSYAAATYVPVIGIMAEDHKGLWRGVFLHKNNLAILLPLGSITFFILAAKHSVYRYCHWIFFWLALVLLSLTGSKSSMLSYILLFSGVSIFLWLLKQRELCSLTLLSVLVVVGSLTAQVKYHLLPSAAYSIIVDQLSNTGSDKQNACNIERASVFASFMCNVRLSAPESAATDRLATASGRLTMWRELWKSQQLRPWLGYGFGGFWLGNRGPSADVLRELKWRPRVADNGFLDLGLELGFVGLGVFFASFAQTAFRTIKQLSLAPFEPLCLYFPALLAYLLLANIGESALFTPNFIFWTCYVGAAFSISMARGQSKKWRLST